MKRVLALDQSSQHVGICRIRTMLGTGPHYDTEAWHIKGSPVERLLAWEKFLHDELHHVDPPYDLVACEDYARVMASGIINHKILGLIELACYKAGIPLLKVPIKTAKLFATGDGDAEKEDMKHVAVSQFGIDPGISLDESDAFWIGIVGFYVANGLRTGQDVRNAILDSLSRTPDQIKAAKAQARVAAAERLLKTTQKKEAMAAAKAERARKRAERTAKA